MLPEDTAFLREYVRRGQIEELCWGSYVTKYQNDLFAKGISQIKDSWIEKINKQKHPAVVDSNGNLQPDPCIDAAMARKSLSCQ